MAAPSGTQWSSPSTGTQYQGRIGLYVTSSNSETQTTVTAQVWYWSQYSCQDSSNTFYFDWGASANSALGNGSINTPSNNGWNTANQVLIGIYSKTYNRGTSSSQGTCSARFTGIEYGGGNSYTCTVSFKIPARNKYTISYNANGGSGSMSADTVSYGSDYTTKANAFSRTGYSFNGWNEASDGSGTSWTGYIGKPWTWTYTKSVTLYAQWKINTYTVYYDANGGSGAPGQQTKTYGQGLTLSSEKPTRPNYNFIGWSTNKNAFGAEYQPGGTYYDNNSVTLYAVWDLAYWSPKITKVYVNRCESDGTDNEEGMYAKVSFRWECCQIIGTNNISSATVGGYTANVFGTSGTTTIVIGDGTYQLDDIYSIQIVVVDSKGGTSSYDTYVDSTRFAIDFKAGGTGVAIGMPAKEDGFHVNFPSRFYENIQCEGSIDTPEGTISGHSIIGDDVYSYGDITAQGALRYNQNILWSGTWHGGWAQAAGEAIFSEPVSIQHSGIVLVFQEYDPNTQKVLGTNINSFFVSKKQIALLSGAGVNFTFAQWFGDQFVSKYLYINDTKITGNVDNATGSWTRNGVTFCNNRTVLTKVIGV